MPSSYRRPDHRYSLYCSGSPFGLIPDPAGHISSTPTCVSLTDTPIGRPSGIRAGTSPPRRNHFEGLVSNCFDVASDDQSPLPIGGHLQHFHRQWASTITDAWIPRMLGFNLSLEFCSSSPNRYLQCLVSHQPITKQLMDEEIQHLLDIRAIKPVLRDQERTRFYSILFLVLKSSGGWRGS